MLATVATAPAAPAPAAPAPNSSAPSGRSRVAGEVAVPVERRCPYCCGGLPRAAKKCGACGEWVVRTSSGAAAAALRLLGWAWVGVTLLAAAGLWYGGRAARYWVLMRDVDPVITPFLVDVARHGLLALVLLQGLTVGVALVVLARSAPRRPRWWT
jgi:hypothetical protein